jgi:large subunit ribosomal protein L15
MLDQLSLRPGARHRPKRIGRGPGTGFGKTGGRGIKGQGKRAAGRETPVWFEGGQMPLVRRLPKRGFTNIHRKGVEVVNLRDLARFGDGATIDADMLAACGLVGGSGAPVKLLGDGDAPHGVTVKVHRASASARRKVEEAGGTVEILP